VGAQHWQRLKDEAAQQLDTLQRFLARDISQSAREAAEI
jgi:hypothetical protein